MTPEEIDDGIALVRDWLDDYPEGTVIALFEARAWEVKGYADWDALCAAEFPRKVQLPRPERREIVGRLADSGMSVRAIASATGASVGTVHADLAGVQNRTPDRPVTGLDGKSYSPSRPATVTTRTTETTEVVDLATGEILNEEVTSEVWEAEQGPSLDDMLAADPAVRAANVRRRGTALLAYLHHPHPDAVELASIDAALTGQLADRLSLLAAQYRNALPRRLSAVKES